MLPDSQVFRTLSATDSRLWLAIRFLELPLHAAVPSSTDDVGACVVTDQHRVVAMNSAAHKVGVHAGMLLSSAQVLTALECYTREPEREQELLLALADSLYQVTPHIRLHAPKGLAECGLLLEISRSLYLFSGLEGIFAAIDEVLTLSAGTVQYGVAATSEAAWLLSNAFVETSAFTKNTDWRAQLALLPVSVLTEFPSVQDALIKTGFAHLGDLAQQISASSISAFRKRFGKEFAAYLARVWGIDNNLSQGALFAESVPYFSPPVIFHELMAFDYPIDDKALLQQPMQQLLEKLTQYLIAHQQMTRRVDWVLHDIYGSEERLIIRADKSQQQGSVFFELTAIQLDNKTLPFAVDNVQLLCEQLQSVQLQSGQLQFLASETPDNRSEQFSLTLARLQARLGEQAIYKLSYCDSYLPEISNAVIGVQETAQSILPSVHINAWRPAWLLAQPEPVKQNSRGLYWQGRLSLLAGPERLQSNWWASYTARDYFVAQRDDHALVWIYRDLSTQCWYAQGLFG